MRRSAFALLAALGLLACGAPDPEPGLSLALNWKPEPEFGGLFEAERIFALAKRGLAVARTGGPGAPVVQMVTARQVSFGIASADEVVLARDRGSDVVAIFATYQTCPQGLMTHAARKLGSLEALLAARGTLAVEPGLPYVKFLEWRYGFGSLQVVPYSYSIGPFLGDPLLTQQVFVTAEPIAARRAGSDPQVFLVADSGYDPYTAVVITHGDTLRSDPARVSRFVEALREGWQGYLADPAPANALMGPLNPEMDAEAFRLAAEAQKPLIEVPGGAVGRMSAERWAELAGQLKELGLVKEALPAERYFANPTSE
jgi:NitT/TauT family transport system substrate-binding protein